MPMWRAYRLESELFGDASREVAQAALQEQFHLLLPPSAAAPSTQLISDISHLYEQLQDVLDSAVPLSAPSTHLSDSSSSSSSSSCWSQLVQCSQLMLDSGLFREASCEVVAAYKSALASADQALAAAEAVTAAELRRARAEAAVEGAELEVEIADLEGDIADRDAEIAERDAEIARLTRSIHLAAARQRFTAQLASGQRVMRRRPQRRQRQCSGD
ncbi:hypothetical protein COHA_008379 [Chlorella ohadii]|uniref:Uncharacterized protein n=1 Tax=Chlorella ohadii TaxID=2649997 RepID=A0AAD5DHF4_9CHLO|nr:hypothetical protein COHA_008379 [Chlorella ohadii]